MKTILYTQNESAIQKNTIVVDGEIFHDFNEEKAMQAFTFIMKKSEKESDLKWLVNLLIKKRIIRSTKFKYIKDTSGILIRSNFQEKDEVGRYMPFIFYTEKHNLSAVNQSLKNCTKLINRTHNEDEIMGLEKAIRVVLYSGLSIGIILLGIIIWKL